MSGDTTEADESVVVKAMTGAGKEPLWGVYVDGQLTSVHLKRSRALAARRSFIADNDEEAP